jgi:peptidoglycan/xylan/chitin deacetylase (PgdA/CDA1 family)
MQFLAESGYNVISLREIINCINENRMFPSRAVAITFDDGYKNNYDVAYPILKEFCFKAAIFMVSGRCSDNNNWPGQPNGIPIMDLLGWDEILEMADYGIEFGAHTLNHPHLPELSLKEAENEIVESKRLLEKHLHKDVLFFDYPYGKENQELREIVQNEFYCAFSTDMELTTLQSDIYSLPRIDMYYFSRNNFLTWLDTLHFNSYIKYRKVLRSVRTFLSN